MAPFSFLLTFGKKKKKRQENGPLAGKKSKTERATEVGDRKVESYDSSEIPARKET